MSPLTWCVCCVRCHTHMLHSILNCMLCQFVFLAFLEVEHSYVAAMVA